MRPYLPTMQLGLPLIDQAFTAYAPAAWLGIIEGPEGGGKTQLLEHVGLELVKAGGHVLYLTDPGPSPKLIDSLWLYPGKLTLLAPSGEELSDLESFLGRVGRGCDLVLLDTLEPLQSVRVAGRLGVLASLKKASLTNSIPLLASLRAADNGTARGLEACDMGIQVSYDSELLEASLRKNRFGPPAALDILARDGDGWRALTRTWQGVSADGPRGRLSPLAERASAL